MARKRKTSAAEAIMEIVAVLPWWGGVVLAVVLYFVLHAYAAEASGPAPTSTSQIGQYAAGSLFRTLAYFGQFLLPFICLVGALVSGIRQRRRAGLLNEVSAGDGVAALNEITWQQFELVIGQWFRQQGYAVTELGGAGADGGVDLVLEKGNERFLVQCKQWRATKVGVSVVRELYGVMAAHGATGGFVITSGSFTEDARSFAHGRNLKLIDGKKLAQILQTAAPAATPVTPATPATTRPQAHNVDRTTPHCPLCGLQMVGRVAKRGTNIGQLFWGCSGYPACKGTMPG